jgi:putative DNA primase/helicase
MIPDLKTLARLLGGEPCGQHVLCPGPGHSTRDRSLRVTPDANAPDGFKVHSFCHDDWRECRDHVREQLGLPAWQPGDGRNRSPIDVALWDQVATNAAAEDTQEPTPEELKRIEFAQALWKEARDPRGTPAEQYLASRGLELPDGLAGSVLRFYPYTPWRNENTGRTDYIACMLAAFTSINSNEVVAVHRIRVDQPQEWPKVQRRMLGIVHHAAVKFGKANGEVVIGEGVETCLAAHKLGLNPTWALGSVGMIAQFPVLADCKRITLLAEAGNASKCAIELCANRWLNTGKAVRVVRPPGNCSDVNDLLMPKKPAA